MVVGNRNHSFLVLFGAFLLGGFGSCGDIALDETNIAGNWHYFNMIFLQKKFATVFNVLGRHSNQLFVYQVWPSASHFNARSAAPNRQMTQTLKDSIIEYSIKTGQTK